MVVPAAVVPCIAAGCGDGREPGAGGFLLGPAIAACSRGDLPHSPELFLVGLGGGTLLQLLFSAGQVRLSASRTCEQMPHAVMYRYARKPWAREEGITAGILDMPFDSSHGIESIRPQGQCGRLWRGLSFQILDIPLDRHRPSRPRTLPNSGCPSRMAELSSFLNYATSSATQLMVSVANHPCLCTRKTPTLG